jgi:hypothetical protein
MGTMGRAMVIVAVMALAATGAGFAVHLLDNQTPAPPAEATAPAPTAPVAVVAAAPEPPPAAASENDPATTYPRPVSEDPTWYVTFLHLGTCARMSLVYGTDNIDYVIAALQEANGLQRVQRRDVRVTSCTVDDFSANACIGFVQGRANCEKVIASMQARGYN